MWRIFDLKPAELASAGSDVMDLAVSFAPIYPTRFIWQGDKYDLSTLPGYIYLSALSVDISLRLVFVLIYRHYLLAFPLYLIFLLYLPALSSLSVFVISVP